MAENIVWKDGYAWAASRDVGEDKTEFLGHFPLKSLATKATEHSGHEIQVHKFNAGGYPTEASSIRRWGYRVVCTCGYRSSNAAGHTREYVRGHLDGINE